METASSRVRVGISGWSYPPWRGVFYPVGLRQADELSFASRAFSSIELNGSFYSLMRPESYQAWFSATPEDFVFAVKGGRYITHMKRLRDVKSALANFFASGVLCLGHKLGPFLWQLPPSLKFQPDLLQAFLELLPRSTAEVGRLAQQHDSRLAGRSWVTALDQRPVRHALEVRHASFADARYVELLRQYGVASCVADSAGLYPVIEDLTADFCYARLHGAKRLYVSGYSARDLRPWAQRVHAWQSGRDAPKSQPIGPRGDGAARDVFVYFDNDVKVRAPFDAQNLVRILAGKRTLGVPKAIDTVTEEPRTDWDAWKRASGVSRGGE